MHQFTDTYCNALYLSDYLYRYIYIYKKSLSGEVVKMSEGANTTHRKHRLVNATCQYGVITGNLLA